MGSKGSKPRKPAQHLPKVGTPQERKYAMHQEQNEVFGTGGGRIVFVVVAILFVLAIASFLLLGIFD